MKNRKFWMILSCPIYYRMSQGKTIEANRQILIFGIKIAEWAIFVPD
jgi:hypothetical protein